MTEHHDFADLLANNAEYASHFDQQGYDGKAHAGLLMVTCMDSRILPLQMVGLDFGDAKIVRTPGGRVTETALIGCIAGVHLLEVDRIMVVAHTRCAMASGDDDAIIEKIRTVSGVDASWMEFGASTDQRGSLEHDVKRLRTHPLIADRALIGGFLYDVDSGRLEQLV